MTESSARDTLPALLVHHAETRGNATAFREKEFGIWQATTWSRFHERVRDFSLGLEALGLERGDRVGILGDNRPEWVITEIAVQAAGGVGLGLYQDAVAEEVRDLADFAGMRFIVAEDQEQVDKILDVREKLPALQGVIYHDPRGLRSYDHGDFLLEFTHVEQLGRNEDPQRFQINVEKLGSDEPAIFSTTSGTTGRPKIAVLTHGQLLAAARGLLAADPMTPDDEFVSFLPLAWIGEQMLGVACFLDVGMTINFPEEPETVRQDMREIGPRTVFSPPRIWENMVSEVQVKIEDASWLKRRVYDWAWKVGTACATENGTINGSLSWQRHLAEWLCFFWIKDKLGLRLVRNAYTGGAALGPDVFRFFRILGIPFKQIYGQTEAAGMSAIHSSNDVKFQTVGRPLSHVELKIADDGEILLRGPSIFSFYYENPEATAEAIVDGWFCSGDAGYLDEDGHLVVIDRKKDVVRLPDGTVFSPQFLENKLKFSPYIREAVVFTEGGRVTAMLVIDFANTGRWAERRHIAYTTFTDLAQKEEVYTLIDGHVREVNADLPPASRVQRYLLLHKELDADDAELTRTRKVRRRFIAESYAEIVQALQGNADVVTVNTEVTYQDGRTAEVETRLRIASV